MNLLGKLYSTAIALAACWGLVFSVLGFREVVHEGVDAWLLTALYAWGPLALLMVLRRWLGWLTTPGA